MGFVSMQRKIVECAGCCTHGIAFGTNAIPMDWSMIYRGSRGYPVCSVGCRNTVLAEKWRLRAADVRAVRTASATGATADTVLRSPARIEEVADAEMRSLRVQPMERRMIGAIIAHDGVPLPTPPRAGAVGCPCCAATGWMIDPFRQVGGGHAAWPCRYCAPNEAATPIVAATGQKITGEVVGAAGVLMSIGRLSYPPIVPGSVVFASEPYSVRDDRHGNLVGDVSKVPGVISTINYRTGEYELNRNHPTHVATTAFYEQAQVSPLDSVEGFLSVMWRCDHGRAPKFNGNSRWSRKGESCIECGRIAREVETAPVSVPPLDTSEGPPVITDPLTGCVTPAPNDAADAALAGCVKEEHGREACGCPECKREIAALVELAEAPTPAEPIKLPVVRAKDLVAAMGVKLSVRQVPEPEFKPGAFVWHRRTGAGPWILVAKGALDTLRSAPDPRGKNDEVLRPITLADVWTVEVEPGKAFRAIPEAVLTTIEPQRVPSRRRASLRVLYALVMAAVVRLLWAGLMWCLR